jgi:hypothetical protein
MIFAIKFWIAHAMDRLMAFLFAYLLYAILQGQLRDLCNRVVGEETIVTMPYEKLLQALN